MNPKLEEIFRKIAEFEKETPYNFCDRWCERCIPEKQMRCKIYLDDLEQRMTCLAHGKEERDHEITEAVVKRQLQEVGEKIEEVMEEGGINFEDDLEEIDLENIDDPALEGIKKHIEFVQNHPLPSTAEQYRKRAQALLESEFYQKGGLSRELVYDFETVAWYHTLLPVKLDRGLAGFHEPACEGDISLIDAIGQFEVCEKAIRESVKALRRLGPRLPSRHAEISVLLALLQNLHSRIQALEESVE